MPVVHRFPEEEPEDGAFEWAGRNSANGNALEISHLSFAYPDGHRALDDVCLKIGWGERVALVGPNGAGKSTLLLHLNGILEGKGELAVAGMAVRHSNLPLIRSKVGVVFQNPDDQLFCPTVFEDVAFGPLHMGCSENDVHERVRQALQQVGMSDYAERMSHHLSAGEKKRIAIATVLAMVPDILVLDEPSSGLDPRARRGLIELLRGLPITTLASTHDMALVRDLFERVVILDQGRIVADGPTRDLLADADLLEAHGLELP